MENEYLVKIYKMYYTNHACREAKGVRGHAPRDFFKRCNLVRFGV